MPTNQHLKVLILPSWYPTERYSMGGIFCQEQARALNDCERDVDVVVLFVDRAPVWEWLRSRAVGVRGEGRGMSPQPNPTPSPYSLTLFPHPSPLREENGLKVYRTQMPRLPGVWPLLYVVWATLSMWRLMRRYRFKPDILHAHVTLPAGLAGALIKQLFGIPLVVTEHTGPFSMLMRNRFATWATHQAMQSSDRVIAVSHALRDQILAYPQLRRHIDIIPNVVDTVAFKGPGVRDRESGLSVLSDPPPLVPGPWSLVPFRLLFVGEMETSIKGVDYLLGAMALLKKRGVDCRLKLVGQGRNRREYETMARRLGVADLCQFVGVVPHSEIARLMSESDLFVLPSLAETFGVVLVEAMAAGLPVVATRCGGPEEIVTPDVGELVEPSNSAALADAIADVLSRLDQFPEAILRAQAEARYGQCSVAGKLVGLYRQVVNRVRE